MVEIPETLYLKGYPLDPCYYTLPTLVSDDTFLLIHKKPAFCCA
jgi:hypothetical protein